VKVKPKGTKYRNLFARGGVIYFERRLHGGGRVKKSLDTADWQVAAERRDAFEALKGIGKPRRFLGEMPCLGEFAVRYLAEDTSHLAPTTRQDRKLILRPDGTVLRLLGATRLDALTPALLREWWNAEVTARGRSSPTYGSL